MEPNLKLLSILNQDRDEEENVDGAVEEEEEEGEIVAEPSEDEEKEEYDDYEGDLENGDDEDEF